MELDDEFSLDSEQQPRSSKVAQSKSMKTVYEQLAQRSLKQETNGKKTKKQKRTKLEESVKKQKEQPKHTKQIQKEHKGDSSCRYIRNRALQQQLKEKALSGVLQIMNMISKTQAERKVE